VYGKKRELNQLLKSIASSSTSVPRSMSAPKYIEMTPVEHEGIRWIYNYEIPGSFESKVINVLKSTRGLYIDEPTLRYALLAFSAMRQGDDQLHENYRSKFLMQVPYLPGLRSQRSRRNADSLVSLKGG